VAQQQGSNRSQDEPEQDRGLASYVGPVEID
jgi:hypothetical protein